MTTTASLPSTPSMESPSVTVSEETKASFDKGLSLLVNVTLAISIGTAVLLMLATPGQPLDFLFSGSCATGV